MSRGRWSVSFPVTFHRHAPPLSVLWIASHVVCTELGNTKWIKVPKQMTPNKASGSFQSFLILFESLHGLLTIWDDSLCFGNGILPVFYGAVFSWKRIIFPRVTPSTELSLWDQYRKKKHAVSQLAVPLADDFMISSFLLCRKLDIKYFSRQMILGGEMYLNNEFCIFGYSVVP